MFWLEVPRHNAQVMQVCKALDYSQQNLSRLIKTVNVQRCAPTKKMGAFVIEEQKQRQDAKKKGGGDKARFVVEIIQQQQQQLLNHALCFAAPAIHELGVMPFMMFRHEKKTFCQENEEQEQAKGAELTTSGV